MHILNPIKQDYFFFFSQDVKSRSIIFINKEWLYHKEKRCCFCCLVGWFLKWEQFTHFSLKKSICDMKRYFCCIVRRNSAKYMENIFLNFLFFVGYHNFLYERFLWFIFVRRKWAFHHRENIWSLNFLN